MGLCSMSERTGGSIPLSTLPFVRISMARRPHHDIAQSGCPYIHGVSSGVYQRASWYFVIEGGELHRNLPFVRMPLVETLYATLSTL
jgi:hypothetical protein